MYFICFLVIHSGIVQLHWHRGAKFCFYTTFKDKSLFIWLKTDCLLDSLNNNALTHITSPILDLEYDLVVVYDLVYY